MNLKKLTSTLVSLLLAFSLVGCSTIVTPNDTSNEKPLNYEQTTQAGYTPTSVTDDLIKQHPDYVLSQGEANFNTDDFTADELTNGGVHYTGLDSLGRTQTVAGVITYKMREQGTEREREDIPDPSGWAYNGKSNNSKVEIDLLNGKTYKGYFYNRSHLIAKSLGGAETQENLITGTRTQNVGKNDGNGGMAYTETKARNYLDTHKDQVVYYKATPIYIDTELVPRSVFVDLKTPDETLNEHVEVFNYCYGFTIDYNTGKVKEN